MKSLHSRGLRIAVIAPLLLLCFGLTGCSGEKVNKAMVQNNLKQLVLGLIQTADVHNGLMPPAEHGATDKYGDVGWRLAILPYIEVNTLSHQFVVGKNPREVAASSALLNTRLKGFAAENLVKDSTHTPYRVFVGKGAAFEKGKQLSYPQDFPDGTANTILIIETSDTVPWCSDQEIEFDPDRPLPKIKGLFPGGFYAAMGDGSIRWIPDTTDEKTLKAMITRNGNEAFTLP
jgi:hypothetical protein